MKKFALLAGAAFACVPSAVMAQDAATTEVSDGGLEEIVVTATKRSENLQDVPISVLATEGEAIQDMGITNARDLTAVLPAVKISLSPIGNFAFIRGIGTPGINQGMEQSVSIFHDGIYMGRSQLSRAPFMDIDRVEVLRGPQSILFGKNTIGGAIHVIDAKPTSDFEGQVSAMYGSFRERELNAFINVPLAEGLSARVSGRYYKTKGYVDNILTGKTAGGREDWTVRGQLRMRPSDTTDVNLKFEHSQFNSGEPTTQLAIFNPFNASAAAFSNLNAALRTVGSGSSAGEVFDDERAVINDGGATLGQVVPAFAGLPGFPDLAKSSKNKMDLVSLSVDQEIGALTLTSITGLAAYKYRDICDCDFSALPLIQVDAREKYSQISQELRLTSPKGDAFEYIVGGYFQHNTLRYNATDSFGTSMAYSLLALPSPVYLPNLTRDYVFDQKQTLWSAFAQGTWNITDSTRLIGGLRWFSNSKSSRHVLNKSFTDGWDYSSVASLPAGTLVFGNTAAEYDRFLASSLGATLGRATEGVFGGLLGTQEHDISRKRNEKKLNWVVTGQHEFTDKIMAYATYSTGTKGGGFDGRYLRDSANTGDTLNPNGYYAYEPETATNYEIGFKSRLFDNRVRFNVSAFRIDVKDFQVSIFDGATGFLVVNAAKARSQGVEVELAWAPVDGLTITGAGSYLDAKWADYPYAPCWQSPSTENRGNCIGRGTATAHRDATGGRLAFAPKFSGNLNVAYTRDISGSLKFGISSNVSYSSSYFNSAEADPIYMFQKRYAKIDARISLGHIDDKWEIALLGKNLTDQLTSFNSNNQPLVPGNGFAVPDRPRSFAVQARFGF